MRHVGTGNPNTPELAWRSMAVMLGHWELLGYGIWAVARRDTGALVGHCGYIDVPGWPGFELAYLLGRDRDTAHNEPVWADTMPSEFDLDARAPSEDFIEPLPGLEIREVHEPDIFRLFFAA